MKLETKYSIGDKVFLIDDNKIYQAEVYQVNVYAERKLKPVAWYGVMIEYVKNFANMTEDRLFDTKEELIKTL